LDGRAIGAEELLAGTGLIDDDVLTVDLIGTDGLVGDKRTAEHDPAKSEAAANGRVGDGGCHEVAEEALLPHLLAAHIEAAELLAVLAGMTAEGDELAVADEERGGTAGGVERGELVDFAGVGVEVEG